MLARFYSGVGMREPEPTAGVAIGTAAEMVRADGFVLRTAKGKGVDRLFASSHEGDKELVSDKMDILPDAYEIAARNHGAWHLCDDRARKLHALNVMIYLGPRLDAPVTFNLVWSPADIDAQGGSAPWHACLQGIRYPYVQSAEPGRGRGFPRVVSVSKRTEHMSFVVIEKSSTRDHEERLVREAAVARGWDIVDVPLKHLQRGRFDSAGADLVVGSVPFISAALGQRKLGLPADDCYPDCLRGYLKRTLRQATVGQAISALEDLRGLLFIKPATRTKRFTGFVLSDPFDTRLSGVPAREPIWWSEAVSWQSEWRCYVIDGEIVHVSHCGGERNSRPSIVEATAWVNEYTLHGAPSAYALDVGVLTGGETALVEVNDGFSLGAYEGLEAEMYFDLLQSRWRGLTLAPIAHPATSPRP